LIKEKNTVNYIKKIIKTREKIKCPKPGHFLFKKFPQNRVATILQKTRLPQYQRIDIFHCAYKKENNIFQIQICPKTGQISKTVYTRYNFRMKN